MNNTKTEVSKILLNRTETNDFMLDYCIFVRNNNLGTFTICQTYENSNWYQIYTINYNDNWANLTPMFLDQNIEQIREDLKNIVKERASGQTFTEILVTNIVDDVFEYFLKFNPTIFSKEKNV